MLLSTNVMAPTQSDPLLSLTFELNPLAPEEEVKVDQRIVLDLLPVQVVYDAVSLATAVLLLCCCCCCCTVVTLFCCCCTVVTLLCCTVVML